MLNCCCVPKCGDVTQCSRCVSPEDDYALLVCHSMDDIIDDLWEILIDKESIGFSTDTEFDSIGNYRRYSKCRGKCFITDISIWDKILGCSSLLPMCCLNNLQNFQVVDRDIFRKSVLILALKLIKLNYHGNYGKIFLFRIIKELGVACYVDGEWIQNLGGSLTGKLIKQDICPPVPCRPCSSVEDNYVLSVGGSGGKSTFFEAYPALGEVGTFEFFVDGVSLFSKTLFGGRCYHRLWVDDLRILAKANFSLLCHFLWPIEKVIDYGRKAFFLKDFLNVSAKFTPKIPEMNIHMHIVVSRLQQGSENLCPIAGADFFAGGSYPQLPYEQAFSFDMKLCPRTPPVLP